MKKRLLAAAMCAAMVLSLAGCGSSSEDISEETEAETETEVQTVAETEAAETEVVETEAAETEAAETEAAETEAETSADDSAEVTTASFAEEFADPDTQESGLRVRYWIPSGYPASSEELLEEIDREIKELADAGYTNVEVANVYESLTDEEYEALEEGDGEESYLFGSSYWKETLRQVLKSAKEYGLTVDITLGPHWPAASSDVDIDSDAVMKEAVYSVTELDAGDTYTELARDYVEINESDGEINLLGVYVAKYESVTEMSKSSGYGDSAVTVTWNQYALDDETMEMLEADEDGNYDFTAPEDNYVVIEIYEHSTGATISYSTYDNEETGYTGYCLDMYNSAGAEEFIRFFEEYCLDDEIIELLQEVGGSFFEDNFSYTAANVWTSTLLETFEENCGYDMLDVLPYTLGIYGSGHSNLRNYTGTDYESTSPFVIADDDDYEYNRILADFIDTWGSCYLEQHVATLEEWAEETFGMTFRTQTYGGNIDSGLAAATVDYPEGETIGFSDQFDGFSMLAAGRDMGGNTEILSSEFGAYFTTGGAYGYAWDDLISAAFKNYSAGVNSLVFHGYSYMYSPDSEWPGFTAFGELSCSGTWSSRDPQWTQIENLATTLRRTQYALQQGTQKTDVAVYESLGNAQDGGPFYDGTALLNEGYTYQLFTPGLLDLDSAVVTDGVLNADGPAYQALVLEDETAVSLEHMQKLVEFADAGLAIVFVGDLPCISTSLNDSNEDIVALMDELLTKDTVLAISDSSELADALAQLGVTPSAQKAEDESSIITIHREIDDDDLYFLYNGGEEDVVNTITFEGEGTPYLLDMWTGEITAIAEYTVGDGAVTIEVSIEAGDAMMIGIGSTFGDTEAEVYAEDSDVSVVYSDGSIYAQVYETGSYTVTLSSGETVTGEVEDIIDTVSITSWDLSVESWTSGDEDDAAVTAKDVIYEGTTDAVSWSEIEGVGDGISGIGTYTTTFEWTEGYGAVLSLPEVGETFEVYVNGNLVLGNQITKDVDISEYLVDGTNELEIVVASSLQNAVNAKNDLEGEKTYGIVGETLIIPYAIVEIS